jgi:glutamate formiminotransferase / formiminotetrahydrofolate cyclodeaminase
VKKIVECIPNFSEGRRKETVDSLAAALSGVPGAVLLDTEMDAAHNRCVLTVAGEPRAVAAAALAAVGKAVELIDLREHRGEHPRMGAADVVPFVPISGVTMEECVQLSVAVASEIAARHGVPVYLYEQSARTEARRDLACVRRGEFEGIREEIRTNPERKPDFGPSEVHPSAGATAVGARFPLIAYNVYLNTSDLEVARAVARAVRFSGGGLRYVKALGFEIKERNQVQVSMNLTNFEATPIFRAFEMVVQEALRYGVSVASGEIVGLVPQKALDACSGYYLRLERFSADQVLENRLAAALAGGWEIHEFLSNVAAPQPVPGGGSAAALAGSLAAALGEMVAGLTEGREKFQGVEAEVKELHRMLSEARRALEDLVAADAAAYQEVVKALRLPKGTDREKENRLETLARATCEATVVPLRTAHVAAEVLGWLGTLAEEGNPNARSDAAVGAQLAYAALKGAQYNVLVNIPGLADKAFANSCLAQVRELVQRSQEVLRRIDDRMSS